MVLLKLACVLALVLSVAFVYGDIRVIRSPQLGFSQAGAHAQAGGFGGPGFDGPRFGGPGFGGSGFGGPGFGPRPPVFGPRPPIFGPRPPVFGGGFGNPGRSISISKSISIGSGGGSASSNAGSNAFGK